MPKNKQSASGGCQCFSSILEMTEIFDFFVISGVTLIAGLHWSQGSTIKYRDPDRDPTMNNPVRSAGQGYKL
jgi:hypothetical protein